MTELVAHNPAGSKPQKSKENSPIEFLGRTPLATLSLMSLAFLPVLWIYFSQLWTREYYRFFPFALLTTFVYSSIRADSSSFLTATRSRWIGRSMVFVLGLSSLLFGELMKSPLVCFAAFVLYVGLLLNFYEDRGTGRSLTYCAFPLLLLIRPPLYLDTLLLDLQLLTSNLSSRVLNALSIDHILQGNIIEPFVGGALGVAEACSGIQSLFTLMFVAAFIVVAQRYALLRAVMLVCAAIFWSLGMNVFRVTTIAVAQVKFGVDLTSGWPHEVVGYIGMFLAIIFLMSADRLLAFVLGAIPDDALKNPSLNQFVAAWNWLFVGREIIDDSNDRGRSRREKPSSKLTARVLVALIILAFISAGPCYFCLSSHFSSKAPNAAIRTASLKIHLFESGRRT